jgi:hypothetical protein
MRDVEVLLCMPTTIARTAPLTDPQKSLDSGRFESVGRPAVLAV